MKIASVLCAIIALCVVGGGASAINITTNPLHPTSSTPVSITAETLFNDAGQRFLNASYTRDGYAIVMDVLLQDLHGSGYLIPAVQTYEGGTVEVGLLPGAGYVVTANIYLQPWQGSEQNLVDTGRAYFYVESVPEPSSFTAVFCGIGALGGVLRLRKR